MPRKKWATAKQFGERLIAIRKARGLTQKELERRSGISQRAISYYESHGIYPPAPVVIELAKSLGLSTDALLGVKPVKLKAAKSAEAPRRSPRLQRLWKRFQMVLALPDRDQRAVMRLILTLTRANPYLSKERGAGRQAHRMTDAQ